MTSSEVTWRVYLPEWLIVYTSDRLGEAGKRECEAVYAEKYAGRVRTEDWRVAPGIDAPGPGVSCLELRLWNLKGEYKDRAEAMDHYTSLPHADIVQCGSAEEQKLLDYGWKMLPAAGRDGS